MHRIPTYPLHIFPLQKYLVYKATGNHKSRSARSTKRTIHHHKRSRDLKGQANLVFLPSRQKAIFHTSASFCAFGRERKELTRPHCNRASDDRKAHLMVCRETHESPRLPTLPVIDARSSHSVDSAAPNQREKRNEGRK